MDQLARVVPVDGQAEDHVVIHRCDHVIEDLLLGWRPLPAPSRTFALRPPGRRAGVVADMPSLLQRSLF